MYVINGSLHESSCSAEFSCQTVNQEMPTGTGYGPGVNVLPRMMAKRSNGGSGSAREAARAVARDQKQGVTTFKNKKHIYIERQRRIYMNTLLESLQALLPDPRPRDRCTLLSEVTDYLRSLEGSLKELAIRKAEIMAALAQGGGRIIKLNKEAQAADHEGAVAAASVSLQPCLRNVRVQEIKPGGSTTNPLANPIEEVMITFVSPCVKGLWSQMLFLFHKHQIDIITATLSTTTTTDAQVLHYIHARVPKELGLQKDDIKEILCSFVQSVE